MRTEGITCNLMMGWQRVINSKCHEDFMVPRLIGLFQTRALFL